MLKHYPIHAGIKFDCSLSDLLRFDWQEASADFLIPNDPARLLRVRFIYGRIIVRILDEFALSIESDPATWVGLVPGHFAYRVVGAEFAKSQSKVWKDLEGSVNHYLFVTGSGCLDVLTSGEPEFGIVPRDG